MKNNLKIKIFIVTYNAEELLNNTLISLFNSDLPLNVSVTVLNNHSNFRIDDNFSSRVKVLHNMCRPDFSKGHLARSWNQALLQGFQDLKNPDADIVIHCQDDTIFEADCFSKLLQAHERFDFISDGMGDNFCSYTVDAVKNIGIWDERFCNVGFQEGDYFLRALIFYGDKSSINDHGHHRVWNPLGFSLVKRPDTGLLSRSLESLPYHVISLQVFEKKWPVTAAFWDHPNFMSAALAIDKPRIDTYVTYPYFEKDILNLDRKGYFSKF